MRKLSENEMRTVNGGVWHGQGAYHCPLCWLTCFGAGIARLCGYRG